MNLSFHGNARDNDEACGAQYYCVSYLLPSLAGTTHLKEKSGLLPTLRKEDNLAGIYKIICCRGKSSTTWAKRDSWGFVLMDKTSIGMLTLWNEQNKNGGVIHVWRAEGSHH